MIELLKKNRIIDGIKTNKCIIAQQQDYGPQVQTVPSYVSSYVLFVSPLCLDC